MAWDRAVFICSSRPRNAIDSPQFPLLGREQVLVDPTSTAKPFLILDSASAASGHGGFRWIQEYYRAILGQGADQYGYEAQVGLQAFDLGSRIAVVKVIITAPGGGTPFVIVAHSRDAILVPRAEFLLQEAIAAAEAKQVFRAETEAERAQELQRRLK